MAAPNLKALTTLNIKSAVLNPTNTMTDIIPAVTANHAYQVDAVYACNIHASERGWITLVYKKGGTEYKLQNQFAGIATHQMVNLLPGKPLYMEDGDSLRVQANASSNFTVIASYSDAV